MTAGRFEHTATVLPRGKVLVAGGQIGPDVSGRPSSTTPRPDTWSAAASMSCARVLHTATLLANGKVLVAGGAVRAAPPRAPSSTTPATDTWSPAGSLDAARYWHTATLLPDGTVLVAGGQDSPGAHDRGASRPRDRRLVARGEHGDQPHGARRDAAGHRQGARRRRERGRAPPPRPPSSTTRWRARGHRPPAWALRERLHTATLLPDGSVLVAGGAGGAADLASAERYLPGVRHLVRPRRRWAAPGSPTPRP